MRKYLGLAIVVALVVSVVPALAGDGESFHALSRLPAGEQAALTPLPDAQLATIEGTGSEVEVCIICLNVATVTQVNVAVDDYVRQLNAAAVEQAINR
jgi:hypothetical protein